MVILKRINISVENTGAVGINGKKKKEKIIKEHHKHIPPEYFRPRRRHNDRLVFGVGINDSDYQTKVHEIYYDPFGVKKDRIIWLCRIYSTWTDVLRRVYSPRFQEKCPTYHGVSVCDEWHTFSNFAEWMSTQDYDNKQLDKDLLSEETKIYSPDTCVFVSNRINVFLTDSAAARGKYSLGVSFNKSRNKYNARVGDGEGGNTNLGFFDSEVEAHYAWKKAKYEMAIKYAEELTDIRVKDALLKRYKY